ncbi:ParB/RepB/Spo0J family partition protein [Enterocloster lavalensis]|uniref:ParB/RepB/Spo0J family partition protein n=1 Tax=Enterocloster lavalensis TaxID=460384 RepID=UPI002FD9E173
MGKWSVMELIGISAEDKQDFQEIMLSPYEVEASETNFYSQENIEELADSIRMVGQQQPTVLGRVDGVYKIISGHRRNLANIHNIETGAFPWDYQAKYLYKDMTPAMLELSLIVGNAFNRRLTPYEETEQAARLKAALIRARDEDGLEITGKLRDVVADILQTSRTKVARMDKINNSLEPEAREQYKAGNLGPSAAYETAKLPKEEQRQIAAQAAAGKEVKHKEVAEKVAEKKAEQAAARAEKAAKKAEAAQTAAAQAGLQAERAAESADTSATLTSAHMNPPEPAEQQEWTTRDWAIYHLRELMGVASYITEDDLIVLQDILMAATGRRDNERH